MREMQNGDLAFFYHSSCDVPGIAGIVQVVREAYPDRTAFDPKDDHYDADSDPDKPRWYMVDVQLVRKFDRVISLEELRTHASGKLKDMVVLEARQSTVDHAGDEVGMAVHRVAGGQVSARCSSSRDA